jgi:RHS repeat-associated protein
VKRHDYLPFGEEIGGPQVALIGGRTTGQGYIGDNTRQRFTGYEADGETGLNFARARYQSNLQGRFISVDPLGRSASVLNPQSFNRYSYVNNNPSNFTDPSGMMTGADASQSWGDVSGTFWGWGDLNNQPHSVGQSIVNNGMNGFPDRQEEGEDEEELCEDPPQTPANQTPAGLKVVSVDVLNVCDGPNCGAPPDAPYGIYVAITYQVVDNDGNAIQQAGLVPRERVGVTRMVTDTAIATRSGTDGPIGPSRNPLNTGVTNAKGQFTDAPFGMIPEIRWLRAQVSRRYISR